MLLDDAILHGDEEVARSAVSGLHLLDEVLHTDVWKGRLEQGEPHVHHASTKNSFHSAPGVFSMG